MIHRYPKVWNLGTAGLEELLDGDVQLEEKVDGSQFSFVVDSNGVLQFRSHGVEVFEVNPGMFHAAVESVKDRVDKLVPGYVYRGEFLRLPKHNTLRYSRIPEGHIIIFDIERPNNTGFEFVDRVSRAELASGAGFEAVPVLGAQAGNMLSIGVLNSLLGTESVLGGTTIEGIVIKPVNYDRIGKDGYTLMGKYVSAVFREKNKVNWRADNPTTRDILVLIAESLRTPARWEKSIQRLAEAGELQHAAQDIGSILKAINLDVLEEERENIKEALFKHAWPHISRQITRGVPDWYKEKIASEAINLIEQERR